MADTQDDGSETPSTETPSLSPAERFARLLSAQAEDGGADEPEAGKAATKLTKPAEPSGSDAETPEVETETETDDVEADTAPRYKVKVDGEEREVTLEELQKGFSFTAHNTRTAQKLAAEAKELAAERAVAKELTEQYRTILPRLEEIAQKSVDRYAGVNWEQLRAEDPEAFKEHYPAYQLEQEKLASVKTEREAEDRKRQTEQAKEFEEYVSREQAALLESVSEWKDEKKRNDDLGKIAEWAIKELGFSPKDIAETFDHRTIKGLRLAYLGSQMLAEADKAKGKVSEARRSAKPGGKQADAEPGSKELQAARERLKKSGRVDDAADAFNLLLAKKR